MGSGGLLRDQLYTKEPTPVRINHRLSEDGVLPSLFPSSLFLGDILACKSNVVKRKNKTCNLRIAGFVTANVS
jgi:hypothetical protein